MGDEVEVICPKVWDNGTQAAFENKKSNPNIELCGTNARFSGRQQFQDQLMAVIFRRTMWSPRAAFASSASNSLCDFSRRGMRSAK